jgi:threonine dehydrogenase-like Zn-dependent dehydrogenase
LPYENIIPFPEDVKENEAVFAGYIALALAALNAAGVEKGEYVAVEGGAVLSSIICQAALHMQAVPILIDNDAKNLAIAEEAGVYYTVNAIVEDPKERVADITGGRMCDHTIIECRAGVAPHFLLSLLKERGNGIIVSVGGHTVPMNVDLSRIPAKQIVLRGVSTGEGEINSAVYLLAQKAFALDGLIEKTVGIEDAAKALGEATERAILLSI